MQWSSENGLVIDDFDTLMNSYFEAFKSAGDGVYSELDFARFEASREYEQFYAACQIDMALQTKASQTFDEVIEYLNDTALKIQSPSTVYTMIAKNIKDTFGFDASAKPMIEADRGKAHIAIDYEPDAETNQQIAEFLKEKCIVAGVVTIGDISATVTLSNGQPFDYAWTTAKNTDLDFKVTIKVSRNSSSSVDSKNEVIAKFLDNFANLYQMGWDIEPEKYYEVNRDAPYASEVITEYSTDGGATWLTEPLYSDFDTKYNPALTSGNVIIEDA